ncbi:epsin-2 isoform X4 [Ischnura elegans]|uniref:epsin-2 isoform X4 n=1 Tax=Ischnura elegans TaxID=197161 RepID=UPI001ED866DF|nr:epsin-2 isoform X4 [Ischnura elegans]
MRRGATVREELMQANMAGIRRNLKNLAHNYSDAQVKVREATSNDPWGPSSTLMSEIADLTYNVMAFTDIMQMIWKRLNDHGRNWRHVYKALVLLEYLIKTGTEKVAQQCKENIYAIQTLKDFQYFEESKDHGLNVREKAKQLVLLLKDEERLRNERARALKAKERFAQAASGFGSDGMYHGQWTSCEGDTPSRGSPGGCRSPSSGVAAAAELECARPQTVGEEELQLQLALAMSREEAEQEEQRRRSDDVRLQLALSQSEEEFKHAKEEPAEKQSHMLDLLDVNLGSMAPPTVPQHHAAGGLHGLGGAAAPAVTVDPWGMPTAAVPPPPVVPPPTHQRVLQHPSPLGSPVARPQTLDISCNSWNVVQNDPWSSSPATGSASTSIVDPWAPVDTPTPPVDPWKPADPAPRSLGGTPTPSQPKSHQNPWSPSGVADTSEYYSGTTPSPLASPASNGAGAPSHGGNELLDEFDAIYQREKPLNTNGVVNNNNNNNGMSSPDPFDLSSLDDGLPSVGKDKSVNQKKTPASFLGENSSLVNLDNLVPVPPGASKPHQLPAPSVPAAISNPFSPTPVIQPSSTVQSVIYQPQQISRKSPFMAGEDAFSPMPTVDARPWGNTVLPTPILPNSSASGSRVLGESQRPNPFLS